MIASDEFKAALGEQVVAAWTERTEGGAAADRGPGQGKDTFHRRSPQGRRNGGALRPNHAACVQVAFAFPEDHALSDEHLDDLPSTLLSRALVEGAGLAELDWDTYKTDRKDRRSRR